MSLSEYLSNCASELMKFRFSGIKVAARLSSIVDDLILDAFNSVFENYFKKADFKRSRIAVLATGGYGRRELTTRSDIDIMLLAEKRDEATGKIAKQFLYYLWDKGMNISHSFRTLDECLEDAMQDITIRTSLMESRFIIGDEYLFKRYKTDIYQKIVFRNKGLLIKEILHEVDKRHKKFGDSAYLLEPDVKEGKGGLRDMHAIRWLAKTSFRLTETEELNRILSQKEYMQLIKAFDFLLKIRLCLHTITKRRNDILSFELHKPTAEKMGIKSTKRHHAAEILMRLYYKKADFIFKVLDKIMHLSRYPYIQKAHDLSVKKLSSNFLLSKNEIIARNHEILKNASAILEAFYIYSKTGGKFSYMLKNALLNKSIYISRKKTIPQKAFAFFLKILKGKRVYDTLRQMHDAAVLDRFIPEFGSLRHLVIYEPYHKYTVDEHTLISIKNLENLKNTKDERTQYLRETLKDINLEFLFLAILLHDVGKGIKSNSGRKHEEKGYKAIKGILERFELSASERHRIEFLVKNHVILSKLALTRDSDAPETITSLCEIAENEENLKYLLLMTYADITAVNPHFWTEWKAYLLIGLVKKAINHMRGVLEKRFDIADPEINKFLEDMPHRYLISNTLDEMLYDFGMVRQISEHKVLTSINMRADGTAEIVIVTYDILGLFLRIVRVLSRQGLNIIRARLYSSKSGFVVDKILLSNWSDIFWEGLETELIEKLKSNILRDSRALLEYDDFDNSAYSTKFLKGIAKLRLFEHFVEIDNETSSEYSILEITSPDRIGLLYDISSKLYNNLVDITSAIINTEEGIAQDVFYLQSAGAKLDDWTILGILNSIYTVVFMTANGE